VGPERFEGGGAALRKFMFCDFKLRYECRPLRIGEPAECGIILHTRPSHDSENVNKYRVSIQNIA
jgi:hypothetical protein